MTDMLMTTLLNPTATTAALSPTSSGPGGDEGGSPGPLAVSLSDVSVRFGAHQAVRGITLEIPARRITALVGPSGCGKTTILRAVNRLHDRTGGVVTGSVLVGDTDVYAPDTRPELVRSRVGMVFQRPNPFPTMSIFDNVVSGLRFYGIRSRAVLAEAGEAALRQAVLWDSVKDRLATPAVRLSGGQQQRLCIARALAVEPDVLLMDEPCSSLDPVSSNQIEELISGLAARVTILLVTHNMFQARRLGHQVAVVLGADDGVGELVEHGATAQVFAHPGDPRTRAYLAGEVG